VPHWRAIGKQRVRHSIATSIETCMSGVRTELVTALERGMVVLQSFSQVSTPMTLSEVARANGSMWQQRGVQC